MNVIPVHQQSATALNKTGISKDRTAQLGNFKFRVSMALNAISPFWPRPASFLA